MSVEAVEGEELTIERNISGNIRSLAYIGPPRGLHKLQVLQAHLMSCILQVISGGSAAIGCLWR